MSGVDPRRERSQSRRDSGNWVENWSTPLDKGDPGRKRLPPGRRRQTGKNLVSTNCHFHTTSIAGPTWGESRRFETLGAIRDFLVALGGGVSPAIGAR